MGTFVIAFLQVCIFISIFFMLLDMKEKEIPIMYKMLGITFMIAYILGSPEIHMYAMMYWVVGWCIHNIQFRIVHKDALNKFKDDNMSITDSVDFLKSAIPNTDRTSLNSVCSPFKLLKLLK